MKVRARKHGKQCLAEGGILENASRTCVSENRHDEYARGARKFDWAGTGARGRRDAKVVVAEVEQGETQCVSQ